MRRGLVLLAVFVLLSTGRSVAQLGGGAAVYSDPRARRSATQNERQKRVLSRDELPPSPTSMFIDASILINVRADEYVATFALSQEGQTPAEAGEKMNVSVTAFTEALKGLGVGPRDIFVDYVALTKIYGYDIEGETARETLKGFELKKNVSVRYRDYDLLERMAQAASRLQIYDLVKVDYVVKDIGKVQDRLMDEAARIVRKKVARHEKLLGTKARPQPQVYAERYAIYYPADSYDDYVAAESEQISSATLRQRYTIQGARKSRTFYFNGLTGDGFDFVADPALIEPVVQFTLYLKVKYTLESPAPAQSRRSSRG